MSHDTPLIKIKQLPHGHGLPAPTYQTEGASGMDVHAALQVPVTLGPGDIQCIPTGIALEIPPGYEVQVRARSGLALKHGIGIVNAPGTIDSDYRGEVKILLTNFGAAAFIVRRGDRIAQMIIARYAHVAWEERDSLDTTARGAGGFGHTGA